MEYEKLELRDHVYKLPDTYIGSVSSTTIESFVYDDEAQTMVKREVTYVPGLYKIYDEAVVNAIDHATRMKTNIANGKVADGKTVKNIHVDVDKKSGVISITNDGDGIDVEKHTKYNNVWIPELIFGELLTSTNYNADEEKTVGGKNGMGIKLANVFSKEFTIETIDHRRKKMYTQRFFDNMLGKDKPVIKACAKVPYTKITFLPDYERFGMKGLSENMFQLFRKRAFDACACTDSTVSVFFNGEKLVAKDFEKYVDLYIGANKTERPRAYEVTADGRWEVVATYCDSGMFEQVSFVNGINTLRGGKHVDYVTAQISKKIVEMVASKKKKEVKPQHIKENLMVFVKSLIVNPSFDSQTKETLTTPFAKFGSKCELSDKFMDKVFKCGLVDKATALTDFHDQKKIAKTDGKKVSRIMVKKLDDANWAGTKNSHECTLILTEGDSAKSMAVAGLSVIGRDRYGVFPLRGKILNAREATDKKISENEEITSLKKILGLENKKDYTSTGVSPLRYGSIMVLTDQDHDGRHIKALLFALFQSQWPSLYKWPGFVKSMLTPIVKVIKKGSGGPGAPGNTISFYNVPDYEKWRETVGPSASQWQVKYYKGLGTSTADEAKEYFKQLKITNYKYTGAPSDEGMDMAFNKKRADDRKAWLMKYDRDESLDYDVSEVTYEDFINKDLIHFSNYDLERSIPHMCDGFKVSTRKIMFACLKKRLYTKEIRVAQLSGYISEVAAYHHGEVSLQKAIVGMAQDYVGSNNINLLMPNGQFGTRLQGGSDSASARYIHTLISPIASKVFREEDNPILSYLDDDGVPVEPEFYIPIIPMILVNGGLGIGTGFSTKIPNHNPSDVIKICQQLAAVGVEDGDDTVTIRSKIEEQALEDIKPWYLGFQGNILPYKDGSYASRGVYRWLDDNTLEITELPVGTWTEDYKEFLANMIIENSTVLRDFQDQSTDKKVKLILTFYGGVRANLEAKLDSDFKLTSTKDLSMSNIHLYSPEGHIKKYTNSSAIVKEWAAVRVSKYLDRKNHMVNKMEAQLRLLSAKCRFIQDIIDNVVKVMNVKSKDVDAQLSKLGYPKISEVDVVAKKKKGVEVVGDIDTLEEEPNDLPGGDEPLSEKASYIYLTRMPIHQLTFEKKQRLEGESATLQKALDELKGTGVCKLWQNELKELETVWEAYRSAVEREYKEGVTVATPKTKLTKMKMAPKAAPVPKAKAAPVPKAKAVPVTKKVVAKKTLGKK
jgi:DNA topoisomerase-2